jgi:hypothetical protein
MVLYTTRVFIEICFLRRKEETVCDHDFSRCLLGSTEDSESDRSGSFHETRVRFFPFVDQQISTATGLENLCLSIWFFSSSNFLLFVFRTPFKQAHHRLLYTQLIHLQFKMQFDRLPWYLARGLSLLLNIKEASIQSLKPILSTLGVYRISWRNSPYALNSFMRSGLGWSASRSSSPICFISRDSSPEFNSLVLWLLDNSNLSFHRVSWKQHVFEDILRLSRLKIDILCYSNPPLRQAGEVWDDGRGRENALSLVF